MVHSFIDSEPAVPQTMSELFAGIAAVNAFLNSQLCRDAKNIMAHPGTSFANNLSSAANGTLSGMPGTADVDTLVHAGLQLEVDQQSAHKAISILDGEQSVCKELHRPQESVMSDELQDHTSLLDDFFDGGMSIQNSYEYARDDCHEARIEGTHSSPLLEKSISGLADTMHIPLRSLTNMLSVPTAKLGTGTSPKAVQPMQLPIVKGSTFALAA